MMTGANVPVFYDCEASCIGGLPIEIGWAFADMATDEIVSESHLIKFPANWEKEFVWDPDAEKLHRISHDQLIAQGRPPIEIVNRMNTAWVAGSFIPTRRSMMSAGRPSYGRTRVCPRSRSASGRLPSCRRLRS